MDINIKNNYLLLTFDFDQDIIDIVKKKLGMRWSPARNLWHAPITKIFVQSFLKFFPEFSNELKAYSPVILNYSDYVPSDYLMAHQRDAAERAKKDSRFAFYHDVGTGKTILSIELIKQKKIKTLVICPLSIIETAWMEDLKKFGPKINAVNLWVLRQGNSAKAHKFYQQRLDECDLGIINFESFKLIRNDLERAGFKMLLIDESAKLKQHRSQVTQAAIEFSDNMDFVYLLSGNPAPNSEEEYWSQLRLIDPLLLGRSFYAFRNRYFYSHGYGNFKWSMKKDKREEFLSKLASVSEVVEKDDVLDLPEKTENIRKVYLNTAERKAYEEMKKHLVIELGDKEVVAANSAVKLMKLREGTGGFYIGEENEIIHVGNSKLKELENLLEEIGNNQVIIWTHFHYEADRIEEMLKNKSYGRVNGTISSQAVKNEIVKGFKEGELQYLISHPASLGHGVTLVNCTYMIYFSLSHSWELFDQSSGRIYRKGQTNKCSYYYLVADRSVDEIIMKVLREKGKVTEAVFRYIKEGGGMTKIQYLGYFLLFLAYYFNHWPYFKENELSCRWIAWVCLLGASSCLGYVLSN